MMVSGTRWLSGNLKPPEYKLVIECFFDDSGKESQPDNGFVVIAGYIAHDGVWFPFLQKWRHLLFRHGIACLHMKEWVQICNAKGWSPDKRKSVIGEFVDVIRESNLIGLGCAVDAQVWRALPSARRRAFGNAQEFCFQRIIRRVVDRMDATQEQDRVAIIFDRDIEFARPRLGLFEHILAGDPRAAKRFAQISFADSRAYYQLQAADLLAWETRRYLFDKSLRKPSVTRWNDIFATLPYGELDYEGEFWDEDMMQTSFSAVEAELESSQKVAIRVASSPKEQLS